MKEKSNILIVSDMCGYGKVSAAVQMPILSYMGHDVFNLPTMLISNTFPYGKYAILECTSYIEEALQKWNELGIHFDAITTGFIPSEQQAQLIADNQNVAFLFHSLFFSYLVFFLSFN